MEASWPNAHQSEKVLANAKVSFTYFETALESGGTYVADAPWGSVVQKVEEAGFCFPVVSGEPADSDEAKKRAPLLVPGVFKDRGETARKSKDNLQAIYIGVLDFDDVSDATLERIREHLEENDLAAIIYSTWKHPKATEKGLNRFRVMSPLDRPVSKEEWPVVWTCMRAFFGGGSDKTCKDPARGYFMPSAPKGTHPAKLLLETRAEGRAVSVNDDLLPLLDMQPEILAEVQHGERKEVTEKQLKRFAKKLQRKHLETGDWLVLLLKGEPFAQAGSRDNAIYQICQDLGKEFPNADTGKLAERFGPSLSHMPGDNEIRVDDVKQKLDRAQYSALASVVNKKKTKSALWRTVQSNTGVEPYTREWIEAYLEATGGGTSFDAMMRRLIIVQKRWYLFFNGRYIPFDREGAFAMVDELAVPTAGALWNVQSHKVDDSGNDNPKTSQELLNAYGTTAAESEVVLGERLDYFDEKRRVLVLGKCPLRTDIIPERSDKVDRWLRELCKNGEQYEAMCDWLAGAPDLTHRLAMLVLVGPRGVGKTPFFTAVARLWSSTYVNMSELFEPFQDSLLECPMVAADEEFPKDHRGRIPSAKLRSAISEGTRRINRKGIPRMTARGYLRLGAAVNNYEKLDELSYKNRTEDVEALQARMLVVDCNEKARQFFDGDLFVDEDAIAKHALWLREQRSEAIRKAAPSYGIVSMPEFGRVSRLLDPQVQDILELIVNFLETRQGEDENVPPMFVAPDKGVYVCTKRLHESWSVFDPDVRHKPGARQLVLLVTSISDKTIRIITPSGARKSYLRIRHDMLKSHVFGESVELEEELALYSEAIFETEGFSFPAELYPTPESRKALERVKQFRSRRGKNAAE